MAFVDDEVMVDKILNHFIDEKKKITKFGFRGQAKMAGIDAISEPNAIQEIIIDDGTLKTHAGALSKLKKKSAIEEDEDAELPMKNWTFRSVGRVSRIASAKPKGSIVNWTFKRVAIVFRYGPKAPENTGLAKTIENLENKKWTLKSLGKISKMGGFKNESIEKPKQKFTLKGLGKMSKLGDFKNESVGKSRRKVTLKGLGKMSKFGDFKNEGEKIPIGKWTIKSLGKLSNKLGFGGGKQRSVIEDAALTGRKTLKSFGISALFGTKASQNPKKIPRKPKPQPKPKTKFSFKALGKLSKMGVAMSKANKPSKPKRKWTLKSLIRTTQVGVAATEPKRRNQKKNKAKFKLLAKFGGRFGKNGEKVCTCADYQQDLQECTCSSSSDEE